MGETVKHRKLRALVAQGLAFWVALQGVMPQASYAATDEAVQFAVMPTSNAAPEAIADLLVTPNLVTSDQAAISWTAPQGNAGGTPINNLTVAKYIVYYATYSVASLSNDTTAWINAPNTQQQILQPAGFTPQAPGNSETFNLTGLTANTTVYVSIKSVSPYNITSPVDSESSTPGQQAHAFLAGLVPPANFAGAALSSTSIQWSWNLVPSATSYLIYDHPSNTLLQTLTDPTATWTESGLAANTGHGHKIRSANAGQQSGLSTVVTRYTFANTPGQPSFSTIGYSSATLTWNANSNPAGTVYEVSQSTDNFATTFSTPIAFGAGFTAATTTFFNLVPSTTYYLRIRAQNGDGVATAVSPTGSVVLLPTPPPATFSGNAIGVSSITWTWSTVPGAQTYNLYVASNSTLVAGGLTGTSYTESTLSTNVSAGRVVTAVVNGSEGGLSPSATVYTLAAVPGTATYSNLNVTSFDIAWSSNFNPNTTPYEVSFSTDNFVANFSTPTLFTDNNPARTATLSSLTPDTFYYVRQRAQNGDGKATAFSIVSSTKTLPIPVPSGLTGTVLGISSITWTWNAVPLATGYEFFTSTGGVLMTLGATTYTETGLSTNVTYGRRVSAMIGSTVGTMSATVNAVTLAAQPGAPTYSNRSASGFTVTWNAATNPSNTPYEVSYSTDSFVANFSTAATFGANLTATTTDIASLAASTTYYVRVRAQNAASVPTLYSVVTSTRTLIATPGNVQLTAVSTGSVTMSWNVVGQGGLVYLAQLGSYSSFGVPTSSTTAKLTVTFPGLAPDQVYFARVQAQDPTDGEISAFSVPISTYTSSFAPVSLTTTSVTANSVSLTWSANGNPSGTMYEVMRSTDGVFFTSAVQVRATQYTDTNLLSGTVYQYHVRSLNGSNVPSAFSNLVTVTTLGVPIRPRAPSGIQLKRTATGANAAQFDITWRRVTRRVDGSILTNLAGYQIYTSNSLLTPRENWTLVNTVSGETLSITINTSVVTYYYIKAIDSSGLTSDRNRWVFDDGPSMNHNFFATDGVSRLQAPESAALELTREHNRYGADLWVDAQEIGSEEGGRIVKSIAMKIMNDETDQEVTDFVFQSATLQGTLGYTVVNGNVIAGAPRDSSVPSGFSASNNTGSTSVGTPIINARQAAAQLAIFSYNGVDWVKENGFVDSNANDIHFSANRAGHYQIRVASHASGLVLTRVYPRIITPNGDGWNDKVIFQFDNPDQLPISGMIFDIVGAKVSDMKPGPQPESSLVWDGKDSGGRVVPGGVYLYQINAQGTITGTVVVAR